MLVKIMLPLPPAQAAQGFAAKPADPMHLTRATWDPGSTIRHSAGCLPDRPVLAHRSRTQQLGHPVSLHPAFRQREARCFPNPTTPRPDDLQRTLAAGCGWRRQRSNRSDYLLFYCSGPRPLLDHSIPPTGVSHQKIL